MTVHGGKRIGAGRKPGATSLAKRDLASAAKEYAGQALQALVDIATGGESESARVSAANALLDRAYGRPIQGTVEIPLAKAPQMFEGWDIERAQPDQTEVD